MAEPISSIFFTGIAIPAIKIIATLIMGYLGIRLVAQKTRGALARVGVDPLLAGLIHKTIMYSLVFFVFTIVIQQLGFNIATFLAAAGVLGVAIGFAAQTSMSNIISGIFLLIEKPFNYNDTVLVDNKVTGTVKDINLFAVILKTAEGKTVRVPHTKMLQSIIVKE